MSTPEAELWLAYARSDPDAASALLRDPEHYPRQVCFLAQQSAEKALKALLVLLDIEFPPTHDLDRLRESVPPGWRVKTEFPQLYALSIDSEEVEAVIKDLALLKTLFQHKMERKRPTTCGSPRAASTTKT